MEDQEPIRIDGEIAYNHFFTYKEKKYPILFDYFMSSSQYFQKNKNELINTNDINLVDINSQDNIDLSVESIQDFIKFVQHEQIKINTTNANMLNFLAKRYEVEPLIEHTNKYIAKHEGNSPLQYLIIHQNDSKCDTKEQEDAILKDFLNCIKDEQILNLNFDVFYRIFEQYNKTTQDKENDDLIDFYFKCLDKYGQQASILFKDIDFSNQKTEYLDRITGKYSDKFDFHYINSNYAKTIYNLQKDILSTTEQAKAKIPEYDAVIKELKEETENLKTENEQMKKVQDETKESIAKIQENTERIITEIKGSIEDFNNKEEQTKETKKVQDDDEIENLKKEIEQIKQAQSKSKEDKESDDKLKEEIENLKKELEQIKKAKVKEEEDDDELKEEIANLKKEVSQIKKAQFKAKDKDDDDEELRDDVENLKKEIAQIKKAKLKAKDDDLNEDIDELKEEIDNLKKEIEQIKKSKVKAKDNDEEEEDLKEEIENLRNLINQQKKTITDLNKNVKNLDKQQKSSDKLIDEQKDQIEALTNQIKELKKAPPSSKKGESDDESKEEIERLRNSITLQKKSINELTKNVRNLTKQQKSSDELIKDLTSQIKELKTSAASSPPPKRQIKLYKPPKSSSSSSDDEPEPEPKPKSAKYLRSMKPKVKYNYGDFEGGDGDDTSFDEKVDEKVDLKEGLISPFGIRNMGNTCYMNSSLQCLLSLPAFIKRIDPMIESSKASILLAAFQMFIKKHNASKVKQCVARMNDVFSGYSQQDSFEFTTTFINAIHEENEKEVRDLFIGKSESIMKCIKCSEEMKVEQDFSSIILSIQNSRNILYIPYSFKEHPIALTEKPEQGDEVTVSEARGTRTIGDYIFVSKDANQFQIAKDFSLEHASFYAFQLPPKEVESRNALTIVQMKNEEGVPITQPFIVEVPIKKELGEEELKNIITRRLRDVIKSSYKFEPDKLKDEMRFTKPDEFPVTFSVFKKSPICASYINIRLSSDDMFNFNFRTQHNQKKSLTLEQLFKSHVQQSQIEAPCTFECDHCHKRSRVLQRVKYTKLPKIFIFQIKRSNGFTDDYKVDDTEVSFPNTVSIGVDDDFNEIKIDPYDDDLPKYELRAVSQHSGSFSGGHYWALCKRGNSWYDLNDSSVDSTSEPTDGSSSSYWAFYQQLS